MYLRQKSKGKTRQIQLYTAIRKKGRKRDIYYLGNSTTQPENNTIKRDGIKKGKIPLKIHITFPTKSVTIMYHHKNPVSQAKSKNNVTILHQYKYIKLCKNI